MLDIEAKDSICALSTPPGKGGIALVRVSGNNSEPAIRSLAPFLPKNLETHKTYFGNLINPETGLAFDEALVLFFKEGRSYTGEMTFEISCHGSEFIYQKILRILNATGIRLAEKGEFTFRAFKNGNIDLVQAESVLDLIESETEFSARAAYNQLDGQFSQKLKQVEDQLLWVAAQLEAEIDFTEQDISVADYTTSLKKLNDVKSYCERLVTNFEDFKLINKGLKVALVGAPNAGKSSLLNKLLGFERSIVSQQEGTTRDFIEASFYNNGYKVNLVDTAGLRKTTDDIEMAGIKRTYQAIEDCDLVFYLHDMSKNNFDEANFDEIKKINKRCFKVGTKRDIKNIKALVYDCCVSSKEENGMAELLSLLDSFYNKTLKNKDIEVIQTRHISLLKNIIDKINQTKKLLELKESPDLCVFELKDAVISIHQILGKQFDDQIMDRVFGEFCLGK